MAVRLRTFRSLDMGLRETYSMERISPARDRATVVSLARAKGAMFRRHHGRDCGVPMACKCSVRASALKAGATANILAGKDNNHGYGKRG